MDKKSGIRDPGQTSRIRNNAIFYVAGFFSGSPKSRRQSVGAVVGSGMDKNQDPRYGINIPDAQHFNILCGRILQRFAEEPASVGWCCCWIRDGLKVKSGINIRDAQRCNILLTGFFSGSPKSRRQSAGAVEDPG